MWSSNKHLFRFELYHLRRNAPLGLLLFLLLLTASVALLYGRRVQVTHTSTLDSIAQQYQQNYQSLTPQQLSFPVVVDYRLQKHIAMPSGTFTYLSTGFIDLARYYLPVSLRKHFYMGEERINNPAHLQTGSFDLAFLLLILFPLAAIFLCYNAGQQDREQGVYALMVIQGGQPKKMIIVRLFMRYVLLLVNAFVISLTGVWLTGTHISWLEVTAWLAILTAYITCWMSIIWLILSFRMNSPVTLITMLSSWLLFILILPACFYQRSEPTYNTASLQREIEWDTWALSKKELLDSFYQSYPAYRDSNAYDTSATAIRSMFAYYDLTSRRIRRLYEPMQASRRQVQQAVTASYQYNPVIYTQALLNSIAHTDLQELEYFSDRAADYRREWDRYFYRISLQKEAFHEKEVPVYHPQFIPNSHHQWLKGFIYLCSVSLVLLLCGLLIQIPIK